MEKVKRVHKTAKGWLKGKGKGPATVVRGAGKNRLLMEVGDCPWEVKVLLANVK